MARIFCCLLLLAATARPGAPAAQTAPLALPTTSPRAVVLQQVAATDIEVTYFRPLVGGRAIFGALVPWGQVWRTGANNATRIRFTTPVALNGTPVDSGVYELFTIPGEREWVVILQRSRGQWGSYAYDPANDAARFTARPAALAAPVENFTIAFSDVTRSAATMSLAWDRVGVPIRITIDLDATVSPRVEAALAAEGKRPYFLAAMYYYENDLDLDRAATLMRLALEGSPGHIGMLYRLALILEKQGDIPGARLAAEQSLAGAAGAAPELRDEYTRLNTALLARLRSE